MKGLVKNIDDKWCVVYNYDNEKRQLSIFKQSLDDYILQDNDIVEFIIQNDAAVITLISSSVTWKEIDVTFPSYSVSISDDFQIGPEGAYEDGVEENELNEFDITTSQRFLEDRDYMTEIKRSEPIEENRFSGFNFEVDKKFFAITPALNLNFHGGFTFELEWLFFGLYFSILNRPKNKVVYEPCCKKA